MAYEMMVGLQVNDAQMYQAYRDATWPLMEKFGGSFGYDFLIDKTLKSSTSDPMNRVFTIRFASKARMEEFFSNPDYKKIKTEFFEKSVSAITVLAAYERP